MPAIPGILHRLGHFSFRRVTVPMLVKTRLFGNEKKAKEKWPAMLVFAPSSRLLSPSVLWPAAFIGQKSKAWNTCGHFTAVSGLFPLSALSIYHLLLLFSWEVKVMLSMRFSKIIQIAQTDLAAYVFFFHLDINRRAIQNATIPPSKLSIWK